jgi:hypothetical protein
MATWHYFAKGEWVKMLLMLWVSGVEAHLQSTSSYNKLAEYSTGICELTSQLTVTVSGVLKIDRFNDSSSYKLDMCFTGVRLRAQLCTASISLQPSNGHAWNRVVAQ